MPINVSDYLEHLERLDAMAADDGSKWDHSPKDIAAINLAIEKLSQQQAAIGNEPMASCLDRLYEVLAWGGEPHAQPFIKLNALEKTPQLRFDWTQQSLRDVARWANRRYWRYAPCFDEYRRSAHTAREAERFDPRQGLFL